jgi:hypothetical protein
MPPQLLGNYALSVPIAQRYSHEDAPESYCRYYRKITIPSALKHSPKSSLVLYTRFRNLPHFGPECHIDTAMPHFPQNNATRRSPRIQLNGSITAAVLAEGGQRARAKLQSISVNGGLLQLPHELTPGDFVEIAFHTRAGAIHGMAEMLNPTRKYQSACLQAFRFIAIGDDDHRRLRMALESAADRRFLGAIADQPQPPQL